LPKLIPPKMTMVILKRPSYRAALEGYLDFIKTTTVRLEDSALNAPLENLPKLYQLWGTLLVMVVLLEVAEKLGYSVKEENLVRKDGGGHFVRVLPNGKPALILIHPQSKTTVELTPEKTYGKQGDIRSISYGKRPDISVKVQFANGTQKLYLFDPKYKLDSEQNSSTTAQPKPKSVDIDKMHAYRDAIRDEKGNSVVEYAAILYPGNDYDYHDGLEALRAYPGKDEELKQHLRRIFTQALSNAKL
ncbi:MAG: nuclease domain-containing protein, partial [Chroococcales cyanobacterium]